MEHVELRIITHKNDSITNYVLPDFKLKSDGVRFISSSVRPAQWYSVVQGHKTENVDSPLIDGTFELEDEIEKYFIEMQIARFSSD